ncbi:hypothetical protein ACFE04_014949 [Oxalis oulophora]
MVLVLQISSTPTTKHGLFHTRRVIIHTKSSVLCLSKSNNSDSEESPPEGDIQKQELLAKIAQLQAQKYRLTDYLDERSAYLTQFAEEANSEFDKIGEDALKGLDEAGSRIMENMESQMQAFEETMDLNRQDIERSNEKLTDFEDQMVKDLNEGLFFKSLGDKKPIEPEQKVNAKEEASKIKDVTIKSAGSKTRRNIYLAFIGLLVAAVADVFVSSSPDWRKVAFLGAILAALLTQFSYEQKLLSETEENEKDK